MVDGDDVASLQPQPAVGADVTGRHFVVVAIHYRISILLQRQGAVLCSNIHDDQKEEIAVESCRELSSRRIGSIALVGDGF